MLSAFAPLMYAELLSNIRQVSVIASLPTPSTPETKASLSNDRKQLKLVHDGVLSLLSLPARVADVTLQQPRLGSQETSWRLALENTTLKTPKSVFSDGASAPWPASTLSEDSQISCTKCESILLVPRTVQAWKDLPSENWAEMMDFWHCHKPDVPEKDITNGHSDSDLEEKGYGASSRFVARPSIGFVDLTYLLVSRDDCRGLKHDEPWENSPKSTASRQPVYCEQCKSTVGAMDPLADGIRLYKWSLSITQPSMKTSSSYPLSHFLTALLLSQLSSQATSKFILHSNTASTSHPPLHLWLFAPHLTISVSTPSTFTSTSTSTSASTATAQTPPSPLPASKFFYRPLSHAECTTLLEKASMSVEEVVLPVEVVTEVWGLLRESTSRIPAGARKFREWDVGLLERFVEEGGG